MDHLLRLLAVLKDALTPKRVVRCLLLAGVPALIVYVVSLTGMISAGFDIMQILKDPAQQSGESSFLGFLSNIGIALWVSSAAVCFFVALTSGTGRGRHRELLFLVGALSSVLAIDDFFMIHDRYVSEKYCYLLYAILAGALLARHFGMILRIDGFAYLFAGLLLALSIVTDVVQDYIPLKYEHVQVFEEGFKFLGAATWLYFTFRIGAYRPADADA